MGLRYLGPIDGHNLPLLISSLEFAKTCDQPVVLHVLTKKGRGYDVAIQQPEKFHGTGPYDIQTGASPAAKPGAAPAWQDVFGQTMIRLCQKNNFVVGITAAMPSGTGLKALEKAMPQRYYDVGIAEEHAVLFAAGMATMGFHPVCAIYSTVSATLLMTASFTTWRCRICRWHFLHGPGGAFAAGTARRTTALSSTLAYLLSCVP